MPIANARGGITQYALENWRFIDKSAFIFDFATKSPSLDFEETLVSQGCKIRRYRFNSVENEASFRKELRAIMKNGYDAVHLHTSYWNGTIAEEIAMEIGIPRVIVHAHSIGILYDGSDMKQLFEQHEEIKRRFAVNWRTYATDLCACSDAAANWLFDASIPRKEIHIMKNAVDTEKFSYKPDVRMEYRKKFSLDECFVIGHVGRFTYEKNHEFLLRVFRDVARRRRTARLMLIGDGETLDETRDAAREYEIEDRVMFLGRRDDVAQLMQAMDLFVLPSRFEGLSLVLIEAQTAGLKCLAADTVPTESKVTANISYLPLDSDAWSDAIVEISDGYVRCDCSGSVANAGYSLRENIKLIKDFYRE
jgi:glycosyltransferase involved in cell wall biosynthesis